MFCRIRLLGRNYQVQSRSHLSQSEDFEDISNFTGFTFQQYLPIVSQLTGDPAFIPVLRKVRNSLSTCDLFYYKFLFIYNGI